MSSGLQLAMTGSVTSTLHVAGNAHPVHPSVQQIVLKFLRILRMYIFMILLSLWSSPGFSETLGSRSAALAKSWDTTVPN